MCAEFIFGWRRERGNEGEGEAEERAKKLKI
jgi:hypothetical protein